MRVSHDFSGKFDDPNLVSCAGLAPVLQLADRAGLRDLVGEHVRIDKAGGANARLKVPALVAGMIAGECMVAGHDDQLVVVPGDLMQITSREQSAVCSIGCISADAALRPPAG